jgi:conjugal transfer pilus assembly protein TraD
VNTDPTARSPRRHYWLLIPFAVLMALPAAWAMGAVIGGVVGAAVIRAARATGRSRATAEQLRAGGLVLGAGRRGASVVLADSQLSAHGLILGATGAGKTTTLLTILIDQIERGAPVVAVDLKGSPEFERTLTAACAACGRKPRVWTPDGPSHWNPLAYGNPTELKDKIISTERFTEPHYQRAAERYVQTVLQVLEATHPDRPPTLAEVVSLSDPQRLAGVLRRAPRPLAHRVQDYIFSLTHDQLSAVRGLGTRLAIVTESHTGRYLAPPEQPGAPSIDLRTALGGGDVVLFSLHSSSYGKLAAQLGTLAIQDLVSAAGQRLRERGRERPARAIIAIDEFSALGADHVIALLARGRESGFTVLLATQELADLDRAAPGLRDQILGNTAVKIAHRQDVPSSAQTIAQMAGTVQVWEETQQLGGGLLGPYGNGRGTRRRAERFVVHPNEIKSLRTGEAVLITKLPTARARTVKVARPRERPGREL